jgi:hypothetical protein
VMTFRTLSGLSQQVSSFMVISSDV